MGTLTIYEAVVKFLQKERAWAGAVTSDGQRLMSYGVVIGYWDGDRIILPESTKFYSRTTSRHRGMLRNVATDRGILYIDNGGRKRRNGNEQR